MEGVENQNAYLRDMEETYMKQYKEIVRGNIPPMYSNPEERGNDIEKCKILKPVEEIEYSSYSKSIF